MDVRVLRYFLAVAREQTISGAAEVLHMTQPPLSKQLRELEEELGKQLFYRGKRRITLTKEGMLLRKRAEEIVSLVEKPKQRSVPPTSTSPATFTSAGGETEYAPHCPGTGAAAHPGICVHFLAGMGNDVAERLDRGLIDFGTLIEPVEVGTPSVCRARMCGGSSSAGTILWPGRRWSRPEDLADLPSLSPADGGRKRPVRLAGV